MSYYIFHMKTLAENLPSYKSRAWDDDRRMFISRGAGDFYAETVKIDGNQIVVTGKALDENAGHVMITERYDAKEVIGFYTD